MGRPPVSVTENAVGRVLYHVEETIRRMSTVNDKREVRDMFTECMVAIETLIELTGETTLMGTYIPSIKETLFATYQSQNGIISGMNQSDRRDGDITVDE